MNKVFVTYRLSIILEILTIELHTESRMTGQLIVCKKWVACRLFQVCILIFAFGVMTPALAQKTDLVYLTNGDRITGDIKSLERGRLLVKTHSLGNLYIEWAAVDRIVSNKPLQLELASGRRVLGKLVQTEEHRTLVTEGYGESQTLSLDEVVRIDPIYMDRSFWRRLDGKIGFGITYTKGSEVGQLYFHGRTKYRKVESEYQLNWNSILTSNGTGTDSQRGNISGIYRRYLKDRWFWTGLGNIDKNDELGIDARFSAGGGGGRILRQRKDSQISLMVGAVATRENTVSGAENDTNIEGIFIGDYGLFKFATPKTELRSTLTIWPSITDWGRVRGNFDITLGQEIINDDISISLSAYMSYDNQPPGDAANEDYAIITSLDYSF